MLDENHHLIQCILDHQSKGKTAECAQYVSPPPPPVSLGGAEWLQRVQLQRSSRPLRVTLWRVAYSPQVTPQGDRGKFGGQWKCGRRGLLGKPEGPGQTVVVDAPGGQRAPLGRTSCDASQGQTDRRCSSWPPPLPEVFLC